MPGPDMLIAPAQLRMYVFENALPLPACRPKLERLRGLHGRLLDGTLKRLPETRVEQSFNEHLFAEVFDYSTLLMHGASNYHLQPKQPTAAGAYSDFSLGFFGPAGGTPHVHAELKGYRQQLDDPQPSGNHVGITPVRQAFNAVRREVMP